MRDLASVGVGGLALGWLGITYRQRTMSTYNHVMYPILDIVISRHSSLSTCDS